MSLIETLTLGAAALEPSEITVLLLSIAAMLGLARLLGEFARSLGQPAILGEILAGILLGPTVLGAISPDMFHWLFPETGSIRTAEEGFVVLCASLLLLVVGLDVDLSTVWRQGKATLLVSSMGIALPFALGTTVAFTAPHVLGMGDMQRLLPFAIFMGIALSITALPVIAKILMDLNLAKSDMGMLIISSAMLNDLVGWIGFAVVLALLPATAAMTGDGGTSGHGVTMTIGLTFGFLIFMMTIGRWIAHRILPYVQAHWSWPGGVLTFVFVIAMVCAGFTEHIGIHSIFGAFIAGVAIGDSHHLTERTRDTIHQFVTNIFAPVFFASIGLRINFVSEFDLVAVVTCLGIAAFGKILGSYAGARVGGMSKRESWALGFGMVSQGAVGIILGQLAFEKGLITESLLVAIVIMALSTSLVAGPAMQAILRRKSKRSLINVLSGANIMLNTQGQTIDEVIKEIAERAAEVTDVDAALIASAVLQRERVMHTGLPNGIAVPHARMDELAKPCLILARSQDGVDFDAPDGQPARLIAMILTPTDQSESQIEMLAMVADAFHDAAVRQKVLASETTTELRAVLNLSASLANNERAGEDLTKV